MEMKFDLFKKSEHPIWRLVLGFSTIAILLFTAQYANASTRQCVCHLKPSCPFDVCSAGFDNGHLMHEDPQGRCDSCGNGVRECCATVIDDSCKDPTEVAVECCNLDTDPNEDPNHCDNNDIPGCIAEECDDGDNDCNTNGCTEDCKLTPNCDDGEDCTVDACTQDGLCEHSSKPDNESCEEGDLCSDGDQCQGGICIPGDPIDCSDELECSTENCAAGQCDVDLGNCPCLEDDDCDDNNECTTDVCGDDNMCDNTPVPDEPPQQCDDENPVTSGDHCEGGMCVGCGNAQKDNDEACDGDDDSQCEDQLGCNDDCTCREPLPPMCNNGVIDPGEECGETIDGQAFDTCSADSPCNPNTCQCAVCGNGEIGPSEECEFDANKVQLTNPACPAATPMCSPVNCQCQEDSGQVPPPVAPGNIQGSGDAVGSCSLSRVSTTSQGLLLLLGIAAMSVGLMRMQMAKKRK